MIFLVGRVATGVGVGSGGVVLGGEVREGAGGEVGDWDDGVFNSGGGEEASVDV